MTANFHRRADAGRDSVMDMMNDSSFLSRLARRTFLSRIGVGAAALAALPSDAGSSPVAVAEPTPWQPARHAEDDWFDAPAAKHRFFIDTTEGGPFGQAIAWSRNFLEASASGYSLTDADNAIIICARHFSTPFAFTDAMWAKHGALF